MRLWRSGVLFGAILFATVIIFLVHNEKQQRDVDINKQFFLRHNLLSKLKRALNNINTITTKVANIPTTTTILTTPTKVKQTGCAGSLAVVTAASKRFQKNLRNLIGSIQNNMPDANIIVFDTDIDNGESKLKHLERLCGVEVVKFPFSKYPKHVQDHSTYAFKPLAIFEAFNTTDFDCYIWLDSGQEIRNPLLELRAELEEEGYFFIQTGNTFPNMLTHRSVFDFFRVSNMAERREIAGGTGCGFKRESKIWETVFGPWAECALKQECISPVGTHRGNNRQDQTALNFIVYTMLEPWLNRNNRTLVVHQEERFWHFNMCWMDNVTSAADKCKLKQWEVSIFTGRGSANMYVNETKDCSFSS